MHDNPYESPRVIEPPLRRSRLVAFWNAPMPVRRANVDSLTCWVCDVVVALALWMFGAGMAEEIAPTISFLGNLTYSTALLIGWFPLGLWLHYCHVGPMSRLKAVATILLVLTGSAIYAGGDALLRLPLGLAVLGGVLPLELLCGKLVLGMLPGSRREVAGD